MTWAEQMRRARVPELWDEGNDTFEIAKRTRLSEHEVCKILHADREARRS